MSRDPQPETSAKPTSAAIERAPATKLALVTFYRFAELNAPLEVKQLLLERAAALDISGTIVLAEEGVNAALAGGAADIATLLDVIQQLPGFGNLAVTRTTIDNIPFRRFKVKIRKEIVTFGKTEVSPAKQAGIALDPVAWNELLANDDVVLIDARNDYEIAIGQFTDAIDPKTKDFRQFADFVAEQLQADRDRPIAMYCTGGIRCEKASAYLLEQGFNEVYQLEGGILRYLNDIPQSESRWQGECFVFDGRVALDHQLTPADYIQCYGCRRPLSADERTSPKYVEGISCPYCHDDLSDQQRAAFSERRRQVELAEQRNLEHIGARMSKTADD